MKAKSLISAKVVHKTFIELNPGDFIYYINPFVMLQNPTQTLEELLTPTLDSKDHLIQPAKIKDIKGLPTTGNIHMDIQLKRFIDITYWRPEPILHARDLSLVPTITLRINGDKNFWLTRVKLEDMPEAFPVPYCTDRGFLTQYIKSTYGQ